MSNKKWTRLLALTMAVVCTMTVVGAVQLKYDRNQDGRTTVWDLLQVSKEPSSDYKEAVAEVLDGNGDELNPNENGEYEIYTELGLRNMIKNATKGYTFRLMKSIDLDGKEWTSPAIFKGNFYGEDHTISNFKITQSSGSNMGFFGNIQHFGTVQSEVTNLHLKDVQIIVDNAEDEVNSNAGVQYVGAIAGTNSGHLKNCSAEVIVYDKRDLTSTDIKKTYYGTLVGLNTEKDGNPTGIIEGANTLEHTVNITEKSKETRKNTVAFKKPDTKVNSKMALFLSDSVDYATRAKKTAVGIAGFSNSKGIDHALLWQDLTNSTDLAAQALQDRRETAAAEMYDLCTVEWQPAQKMYGFKASAGNWATALPETVVMANDVLTAISYYYDIPQRGLPYAWGTTSLAQFNDYKTHYTKGSTDLWNANTYGFNTGEIVNSTNALWAQYKNADSSTKEALLKANPVLKLIEEQYPASMRQKDAPVSSGDQVGWAMYIGSDCVGQVSTAWRKIAAVNRSTEGFVRVMLTEYLFPTDGTSGTSNNIKDYGVVAVNGLVFPDPGDANGNGTANEASDRDKIVTDYYKNNQTHYLDALAMTSKADILIGYNSKNNAHTMLAISDAVAIRGYNGKINATLSYIVTAEQGGSGVDSDGIDRYKSTVSGYSVYYWRSTCCVDRRTSFAGLAGESGAAGVMGWNFFPVTCDVLRDADSAAAVVTYDMTAAGVVSSSFNIVSTTVNGETKYTSMVPYIGGGYRSLPSSVSLADVHGAITEGTPVSVRLANGKTYTGVFGTAGLTLAAQ